MRNILPGFFGLLTMGMADQPLPDYLLPSPRSRGFVPTRRVVATSVHRIPGGGTKEVPVFGMAFISSGRDYRGRLGHKDKMRRAVATGVE